MRLGPMGEDARSVRRECADEVTDGLGVYRNTRSWVKTFNHAQELFACCNFELYCADHYEFNIGIIRTRTRVFDPRPGIHGIRRIPYQEVKEEVSDSLFHIKVTYSLFSCNKRCDLIQLIFHGLVTDVTDKNLLSTSASRLVRPLQRCKSLSLCLPYSSGILLTL